MTSRRHGIVPLLLGLFLGIGCGGTVPGAQRDGASEVGQEDAGAEDSAADAQTTAPMDVWEAADWDLGCDRDDGAAGSILDSPPAIDGNTMDWSAADATDGDGRDDTVLAPLDLTAPSDGEDIDTATDALNAVTEGACGGSPWIFVGVVPNARELGGTPLRDGRVVACDQLYRGSSLASMTSAGCDQFAKADIKTVIDLRSVGEQTSAPAGCVTQHAHLVSAPLPIPYALSPADYLAILYTAPSIQAVFSVLADRTAYPIYYYCFYGRDRTGVVTAVILSALGASRKTIQDEYALTREAGFSDAPQSLEAVLDEIDRIGGIDAYFRKIGVPAEQVQAVRELLVVNPGSG